MQVSIALHKWEPDHYGNQRDSEAHYCGYNRRYAELEIDPFTGDGFCEFEAEFPLVQEDPTTALFFSLGRCVAPQDKGGDIIIVGSISGGLECERDIRPVLNGACIVERDHLVKLGLIAFETASGWIENPAIIQGASPLAPVMYLNC